MTQLSVIIPCFNESRTIKHVIDSVFSSLTDYSIQVVMVDDASTDSSDIIAQELTKIYPQLTVLQHQLNQGKTSAIITALKYCTGEYTIIQDADKEYNPTDIPSLMQLTSQDIHAIFGSRHKNKKPQFIYPHYLVGGLLITWMANLLYSTKITDVTTGYKMIRTSLLKQLHFNQNSRFGFCAEVTAQLGKHKIAIHEASISYEPRSFLEGKKIRPKDALELIWTLLRYKFKKVSPLIEMA